MAIVDLDTVIEWELYEHGDLTLPRVVELCRRHPALAMELLEFFWAWEELGPVSEW